MHKPTAILLSLLTAGFYCACNRTLNIDQPIALIPGSGWNDWQLQVLRNAAISWNQEVGSELQVTSEKDTPQVVPVHNSELVCSYANGITVYLGGIAVQICSLDAASPKRLMTVAAHELGHVLNIRKHAQDKQAIMNGGGSETNYFRPEDRQLFLEANPDFKIPQDCRVIPRLGESWIPPALVKVNDKRVFALWAMDKKIHFSELNAQSAQSCGFSGTIEYLGKIAWIGAVPSDNGFYIAWIAQNHLFLTLVSLDNNTVADPYPLGINVGNTEGITISSALWESNLYFAIMEGDQSFFWLISVDIKGWTGHMIMKYSAGEWGHFAKDEQKLFIVLKNIHGLFVERIEENGSTADTLQLESYSISEEGHRFRPDEINPFNAYALNGKLLVVDSSINSGLTLYEIDSNTLTLISKRNIEAPGTFSQTSSITFAESPCGLALAISPYDWLTSEIFVKLLDNNTFKGLGEWRRLSSPGLLSAIGPQIESVSECNFIALWGESTQPIEVRSRCFDLK